MDVEAQLILSILHDHGKIVGRKNPEEVKELLSFIKNANPTVVATLYLSALIRWTE